MGSAFIIAYVIHCDLYLFSDRWGLGLFWEDAAIHHSNHHLFREISARYHLSNVIGFVILVIRMTVILNEYGGGSRYSIYTFFGWIPN